ncbi:MAG: SDR family NAD(P)-dependent oxidoreductase, partial [Comamonas sp.]
MDLGIKGRKAVVCASSQGLGLACATSLAREGCEVWINGRTEAKLIEAAAQIEALTGHRPQVIVADITQEQGRAAIVAACPEADILVNNNAGPEPGKIADWSEQDWRDAVEG